MLIYLWDFEVPRGFRKNTDLYKEPLLIDELLTFLEHVYYNMFYLGCTVGNDYLPLKKLHKLSEY